MFGSMPGPFVGASPSSYTILHIVPMIPLYVFGVGTIVSISVTSPVLLLIRDWD
jgi:hypothetical protein